MKIIKCAACGGRLEYEEGKIKYECPYCGTIQTDTNETVETLLRRGNLALESGRWDEAVEYFNKVLDENLEEYRAYVGFLCAEFKIPGEEALGTVGKAILESKNYRRACEYGGSEVRKRLRRLATGRDDDWRPVVLKHKFGDIIIFGNYEWFVINQEDGKTTLLCKDIVEERPFDSKEDDFGFDSYTTWDKSELRKWLNWEFYNKFSLDEQVMICNTKLDNSENSEYQEKHGEPTEDKVFLLTAEDVRKLSLFEDKFEIEDSWWLRTPGTRNESVSCVMGRLEVSYTDRLSLEKGVRPALIIKEPYSPQTGDASKYKVGDVIKFGDYEWYVIKQENDILTLLSVEVVGDSQKAYHSSDVNVTWEKCALRRWLNEEFYNQFSAEDRDYIIKTRLDNPDNSKTGMKGGNPTEDYVFLPSLQEVEKMNPEILKTDHIWWWLRSPGGDQHGAALVYNTGDIDPNGYHVNLKVCGVRPALRIQL